MALPGSSEDSETADAKVLLKSEVDSTNELSDCDLNLAMSIAMVAGEIFMAVPL